MLLFGYRESWGCLLVLQCVDEPVRAEMHVGGKEGQSMKVSIPAKACRAGNRLTAYSPV